MTITKIYEEKKPFYSETSLIADLNVNKEPKKKTV